MIVKSLALLLMSVICTAVASAQSFHMGLKGGVNMNKVDGKSFKEEFKHAYHAGIFAEIGLSDHVGLQPELIWNQSQTETSSEFDDIYDEGISELKGVKLNYLSIPLLLTYTPEKLLTFQLGPQYGILINKDQDLLTNGKSAFKSGEFSVLGGVQLNLGGFKVGGRYVLGLTNINDIDNRDEWKNQGFHLYAGLRLF